MLLYSLLRNESATNRTRHRASTGMYSLTFRVRVTTPPQCERNGTAHAAGASILSRGESSPVCVMCGMRAACGRPGGLPLGSATHLQCCHSNATRAPIVNLPNSAQLGASFTTPPSYIRVRAIVWACGRGHTDTHTDTQTRVTTIHFSWSTTHAKCNKRGSA